MAELAIKIGDSGSPTGYKDGDVLCTFNTRRILWVHAQHICWPRVNGRKVAGPLLAKMFERTRQYKWERVSKDEIKRTNLWTLAEVVYGSKPIDDPDRPGHKIHCNVAEHFAFHQASGKLPLFGDTHYGGRSKSDAATVAFVWDDIEADTPHRRTDFQRWPTGVDDLKEHLFLPTDDFTDATAEAYVEEEWDDSDPDAPVLVKKRIKKVDWETLFPMALPSSISTAAQVRNKGLSVDVRQRTAGSLDPENIVKPKVEAVD